MNEKYPSNGKCNRKSDSENKGKERQFITNFKHLKLANPNLIEVNLNGCQSLKLENFNFSQKNLYFNEKENKLLKIDNSHLVQISDVSDNIRNILVVGITGSGKSSLTNTLTGSDFVEGANTISTTRSFQFKEINQILFLFNGRFDEAQIQAFNKFKDLINESKISQFTTIVRTNFSGFQNIERCKKR